MKKIFVFTFLIALLFQACGFEIVDTGYRGVETRFGEVTSGSLEEGIHFYNPFTKNITELDVREQKWEDKTMAYTNDTQNVEVTFTLNYYPDSTKMHLFYKNIGEDWENKIIPQVVIGKIKEVVGEYKAEDLVTNRLKATTDMLEGITTKLGTKNVFVKNFEINNLDFNNSFESAIEAKVIAVQRAKEAVNMTVRIKEEAKQKVLAAEAEAKSMSIRARALTQNKALVEYEAVQKWNGTLPQYIMGNSIPFINLK
jgi:regulator of protease activity HflC (stomatin/prohibitin superfamily)